MSSLENIKKSEEKPKYKSIVDNVVYFFACLVQNISTRFYKFHWLENLPKGEPFLLISNHPWNFDYFPLKSALDEIWIDIHFLAHKNLLSHPLT